MVEAEAAAPDAMEEDELDDAWADTAPPVRPAEPAAAAARAAAAEGDEEAATVSEAELVEARGRFMELRRRLGLGEKSPPLDPAGLLEAVAVLESLVVTMEDINGEARAAGRGSGAARGGGRGRR